MKAHYHLIEPEDLFWRPSNLMRISNTDFLERTESENLGARLWQLPPRSAYTLHNHVQQEESVVWTDRFQILVDWEPRCGDRKVGRWA